MPPSAPTVGSQRLHCRVLGRLGGGMGEVYLAEDTRLGRQVALKFLTTTDDGGPAARERLVRESQAASVLRSTRSGRGTVDVAEALEIARQVADALDDAIGEYRPLLTFLAHAEHALRERALIDVRQMPAAAAARRGQADTAAEFAAQAQEGVERRLAAARHDGNGVLAHLARPLEELSAFTRWRLPRDPDCADVLADPRLAAAVTAAAA